MAEVPIITAEGQVSVFLAIKSSNLDKQKKAIKSN
jgi:hypothetical protein